jgi:glycyl-tRNA synthetase
MVEGKLEKIVSWAKRRGFIMPSSEIYGGLSGMYDFGPYGIALKNNLKKFWWKKFVEERDDIVGLESSIIMAKEVWRASGHEKGFFDKFVECPKCKERFREDDFPKGTVRILEGGVWNVVGDLKCPNCGSVIDLDLNLASTMFQIILGKDSRTYLRPETAQGMFTNFKQVQETSRQKIPFGMAQIGKSFRNEITPKDFLFRIKEFDLAEIEYFVKKGEDEKSFEDWLKNWEDFVLSCGIKKDSIGHHEHPKESLAHYSKRTVDILYKFPFGTKELAGVANRTDFDLKAHQDSSGKDLSYFDEQSKEKYLPYVIEPTLGIERLMLAIICDAFEETKPRTETTEAATEKEIVLHLDPKLAPVKVAVLPLIKKLSEKAKKVYQDIKTCFPAEFDEIGSIGRRYRRQDEIGTPYCVTIDFETEKDDTVTIRDRDTMKQERIKISDINQFLWEKLT